MKKLLVAIVILALAPCSALLLSTPFTAPAFAQNLTIYCNIATLSPCNTTSNTGTGSSGDPFWLGMGKTNYNFNLIFPTSGVTTGYVWTFNGMSAGWAASGGGSMTWPSGGAGIPNYTGSSSWGTSYSASNLIPDSFIGGISGSPTTGQYWGYNGSSQGWYTPTGSGTVGSCSAGQLPYYSASGTVLTCLTLGTNLSITDAVLNGSGGTPANPTASVGLSAVNGSATTFMRSDAAPALSQSISPTMTGNWVFSPTSGTAITANATADQNALFLVGSATSGESFGLFINAGTSSSDYVMSLANQANTTQFFKVYGDGGLTVGSPTGGDQGAGSINMESCYINGVACGSGGSGNMNDGSGTTTANEIPVSTSTAHTYGLIAPSSAVISDLQAQTAFTVSGTGCTPTVDSDAGPFSGSFTLAATCTAVTVTLNGATGFTAPHGWTCYAFDQTLQAAGTWFGTWGNESSTTTTATFQIPAAAGTTDVIKFSCTYE